MSSIERSTLTVEELSQMLGMSLRSTYVALQQGKIPSRRVGKRYIIGKEAILDWLGVVPSTPTKEDFIVKIGSGAEG